jgi:hypothetical protein
MFNDECFPYIMKIQRRQHELSSAAMIPSLSSRRSIGRHALRPIADACRPTVQNTRKTLD